MPAQQIRLTPPGTARSSGPCTLGVKRRGQAQACSLDLGVFRPSLPAPGLQQLVGRQARRASALRPSAHASA